VSQPRKKQPDDARRGGGHRRRARRPPAPVLMDRDREILKWITRHGVVTPEQIGLRFFWRPDRKDYGKWAAYRRLRAMEQLRLLIRNKPYAHKEEVIRVTREGARIADVGLRPAKLILSQLDHTLAIVDLGEHLLAKNKGAELVTERELRATRYRELNEGKRKPERGRAADFLLRIPTKGPGAQGVKTVAVELDLSRKERRVMASMIRQYDREPHVSEVWWYVPRTRVDAAKQVVAELRAEDRFKVYPHGPRRN
jgi:hypothetical protein